MTVPARPSGPAANAAAASKHLIPVVSIRGRLGGRGRMSPAPDFVRELQAEVVKNTLVFGPDEE